MSLSHGVNRSCIRTRAYVFAALSHDEDTAAKQASAAAKQTLVAICDQGTPKGCR